MSNFDLDLRAVEERMDETDDGIPDIVLGVLDGTTPDEEWLSTVDAGKVLVLAVEGDVNDLAAGFASDVRDAGGELVRFREFLIVTPAGISIDRSRL